MKTYVSIQLEGRKQRITLTSDRYNLGQREFRSPARALRYTTQLIDEGAEITTPGTYSELIEWEKQCR